jgi:putative ATPase
MTLFEYGRKEGALRQAPLAARMRSRHLDEFVGQDHIVGPGTVLRRVILKDQLPSIVFWGPPGSGKTTLASIVATSTKSHFEPLSAVTAGVSDLRRVISEAKERWGFYDQGTILFIDEIHRFNKAQQDVILPYVEDGTITFIGATTENPSFEVIPPLLSRSRVFVLAPLSESGVQLILDRALGDSERGLASLNVVVEPGAMTALASAAGGDARVALNVLELAAFATEPNGKGIRLVSLATVKAAFQQPSMAYDKHSDRHYDTISAFIKTVRGSDPDAAVYWLARMLESGEDPLFIARRILVLAAEDIGLADPMALSIAMAAQQAVHFLGLPEGAIPLAEATLYLATAPKSNSANKALELVRDDLRLTRNDPIPKHLRNAVTSLMSDLDYGKGYKYAHDYPGHFAAMENLPNRIKGRRYYQPSDQGYEQEVGERIRRWRGESRDSNESD